MAVFPLPFFSLSFSCLDLLPANKDLPSSYTVSKSKLWWTPRQCSCKGGGVLKRKIVPLPALLNVIFTLKITYENLSEYPTCFTLFLWRYGGRELCNPLFRVISFVDTSWYISLQLFSYIRYIIRDFVVNYCFLFFYSRPCQ